MYSAGDVVVVVVGGVLKWANFIWLQLSAAQRAWRRLKHKQDGCQVLSSAIVP